MAKESAPSTPQAAPDRYRLFKLGADYAAKGEHRLAVTAYSEAIALEPSYTRAYYNRGISKFGLEDYTGAIRDWKQVSRDPDFEYQDKVKNNLTWAKALLRKQAHEPRPRSAPPGMFIEREAERRRAAKQSIIRA